MRCFNSRHERKKMHVTLAKHPDFKFEKNMIETMLIKRRHVLCFLPTYHPELDPIEYEYDWRGVQKQLASILYRHCARTFPLHKTPFHFQQVILSPDEEKQHFKNSSEFQGTPLLLTEPWQWWSWKFTKTGNRLDCWLWVQVVWIITNSIRLDGFLWSAAINEEKANILWPQKWARNIARFRLGLQHYSV